jgi:hypothetical protein
MATVARDSQIVVEYGVEESVAARVSQSVVEYADPTSVTVRTTQFIVEYIAVAPEIVLPAFNTSLVEIVRERTAPHLSNEQVRIVYDSLQLDYEAGTARASGQGSDPQFMLQWSDDGGHTWSNEYWVSGGAIGQYRHRVIWRRLGQSRDRVFRIISSEPIKHAWLDAFIGIRPGTS